MLKWFIDSDVALEVKILISEGQVKVWPELLPDAFLDENVV